MGLSSHSSNLKHEASADDDVEVYEINQIDNNKTNGVVVNEKDLEAAEIDELDSDSSTVFGEDRGRLVQGLEQRHLQIISLVGVFGTGIFLSSGSVLALTGPLGTFLAYAVVAIIVGLNQIALAEVAALLPVSSATLRHLEHFVDPALSFANGWTGVWGSIMPGEISAAAVVISYWTDLSQAIWISIIIVIIIATNSYNTRFYGEIEYGFGIIKILLLFGLIIFSIVITSGGGPNHQSIGFRYWKEGLFNEYLTTGSLGRFAGFWKAFSGVVYSWGGVQSVPQLAAEVKFPRRTVFTACKRIFYRVTVLMLVTVFCLTLIVSSKNPDIANGSGNATSSPFVVAMKVANIKVLPSIVNAGVLTSAFSAANLSIMGGSRTLFALAVKNQAPKAFLKTNSRGLPYVGVIFVAIFMPLAYMNVSTAAANVFGWFQSLTSASLLLGWCFISLNHISLSRAMRAQGYSRDRLPHRVGNLGEPAAWISGIASAILLLTGGFKNFVKGKFVFSSFFSSYFILPLTAGLYAFWKIYKKTRWRRPTEVDLASLFNDVEENPEPPIEPVRGWRVITLIFS
ncbi:hypothetical protein WICMUC_003037 [Wickerhamomyces mucosus]|uniref:Amino acid permease/ SLC12A domain-containing protein n=1 Tax=Wickerhamomyces mucosus TaxID=1378264 RepID=A0A9P8PP95_9ASCO|nr:hypothetical protein WICMUC_003037 [Wickerhamomyces mucosus]